MGYINIIAQIPLWGIKRRIILWLNAQIQNANVSTAHAEKIALVPVINATVLLSATCQKNRTELLSKDERRGLPSPFFHI